MTATCRQGNGVCTVHSHTVVDIKGFGKKKYKYIYLQFYHVNCFVNLLCVLSFISIPHEVDHDHAGYIIAS